MARVVQFLQGGIEDRERKRAARRAKIRMTAAHLNKAMPYLLDTSGTILLSGSVMLVNVAAGVAAVGVGLIVLNWRFYGGS